jgi:hypothetical protein
MTNIIRPASERQVSFLQSLMAERAHNLVVDFANLSSKDASAFIDALIKAPKSGAQALKQGVYRNADGIIYRVHESRTTGNLYAKVLNVVERKFEYEQGAVRRLTAEMRMTIEDAKAFGAEYDFCVVCGAFLTDAKSAAMGIGPVCAKKYF